MSLRMAAPWRKASSLSSLTWCKLRVHNTLERLPILTKWYTWWAMIMGCGLQPGTRHSLMAGEVGIQVRPGPKRKNRTFVFSCFFFHFLAKCTKYGQTNRQKVICLDKKSLRSRIVGQSWEEKNQNLRKSIKVSYFDVFLIYFNICWYILI